MVNSLHSKTSVIIFHIETFSPSNFWGRHIFLMQARELHTWSRLPEWRVPDIKSFSNAYFLAVRALAQFCLPLKLNPHYRNFLSLAKNNRENETARPILFWNTVRHPWYVDVRRWTNGLANGNGTYQVFCPESGSGSGSLKIGRHTPTTN